MAKHSRLWCLSFALQQLSTAESNTEAVRRECFEAALSSCEFVCKLLQDSRDIWVRFFPRDPVS